ncbi:MAG TPA: tetratricopeptide repeat protein [Flavobacteriales bacterium]|nr:tetratricopeptide repeat protein [Flavobacteriales bacterium]
MKRLLLPLLMMALSLPIAARNAPAALLAQAQEAYAKGHHQQALALYDSINTEYTSAGLLYNIGNCYSKLGDFPRAILYYEKALRLSPGAEDVQANLDMERTKVVDRMNQRPAFTLGSAWDRLQGGKDVDQWARRSIWASILMAFFAGAGLLIRPTYAKRLLYGAAGIALVASVASAALAAYRVHNVEQRSEAIILSPSVEILGEPRQGSTRLFILHQGTKVDLLDHQGEWQEVRLPSGAVGWLPTTSIGVI